MIQLAYTARDAAAASATSAAGSASAAAASAVSAADAASAAADDLLDAFLTTPFINFAINPATGILTMTAPDDYAGPTFAINGAGYLEVTIA